MTMISDAAIQEKSLNMNAEVRAMRMTGKREKVMCEHRSEKTCLRCRIAAAV